MTTMFFITTMLAMKINHTSRNYDAVFEPMQDGSFEGVIS